MTVPASFSQPMDANGRPVGVLSLGSSASITVAAASARVALPTGGVLRIASSTDCYIAFGDSSVTASSSDALYPAGVEHFKYDGVATHIAAIQVSTGGVLTVTGMK